MKMRIGADVGDLKQGMREASQTVQDFGEKAQQTAADMRSTVEAQAQAIAHGTNYKRVLREAMVEVQNLTLALRDMSAEERNSPLGQQLAQQLQEAKAKAADLTDTIGDLRQEITAQSSDTLFSSGIAQGVGVVRDALSAYIAVTGMAGGSTKELEQVVKDVAQVMLTLNAVIGITNALQKQSTLMKVADTIKTWAQGRAEAFRAAVKTAESAAVTAGTGAEGANTAAKGVNTAATVANTVATKAAIVAQKAFNAVAAMNPYVLIAMAIAGASVAMYSFISASHKATEEMDKQKKKAEELKAAQEKLQNRLGD